MGTLYVTKESFYRAEKLAEMTAGIVSIEYSQGDLIAVLQAPRDETRSAIVCVSVDGSGAFPCTLRHDSNLAVRIKADCKTNSAAAVVLDNAQNPVNMLKVTRFGDGFSIQYIAM